MRTVMMTLVVVGLLAAPSLGVLNFMLTADGPIVDGKVQVAPGGTTTIHIWGQGTASGLYALGGDILATPTKSGLLTSVPGSMRFTPDFNPGPPFAAHPGTPGPEGGWGDFGSEQTAWATPDNSLGKTTYVEVCHYNVTAALDWGDVTLAFTPKTVSGFKPIEIDKTGVIGTNTPVVIEMIPEPMTLALLALAGLVAVRRRQV